MADDAPSTALSPTVTDVSGKKSRMYIICKSQIYIYYSYIF